MITNLDILSLLDKQFSADNYSIRNEVAGSIKNILKSGNSIILENLINH